MYATVHNRYIQCIQIRSGNCFTYKAATVCDNWEEIKYTIT